MWTTRSTLLLPILLLFAFGSRANCEEIDPAIAAQIEAVRALERGRVFEDYKREREERRVKALQARRRLNARKRFYQSAAPVRLRVPVRPPVRTPYINTRFVKPNALARYGYR